jgi:hypothetical protein
VIDRQFGLDSSSLLELDAFDDFTPKTLGISYIVP